MTDPRLVHQFVVLLWLPVFLLWGISATEKFGTQYDEYRRRVKRLVPFIW
jgi:protein-S-isoprenylcysteine O-methyltransferase Ste14